MERKNISDKEILDNIDKSISQLDDQRLQELTNLKQLQEIKNEAMKLEGKRLANKYREDHPRVQKIITRQVYNREMFTGFDAEIDKAARKTTPLPNNSWRLHGKIFGQKNEPVNGVTVFFTDEKKNWIRELGSVCTDETGTYSLTVNEKLVDEMQQRSLYLSVSDKNQKLLCRDNNSFFAKKGVIDYKDAYLNGKDCVPPATSYGKEGNVK
jgi:hypothetical protein